MFPGMPLRLRHAARSRSIQTEDPFTRQSIGFMLQFLHVDPSALLRAGSCDFAQGDAVERSIPCYARSLLET
jgi:hypothetical protein